MALMAVTVTLIGVDFARGGSAKLDPSNLAKPVDGAELAPPVVPSPSTTTAPKASLPQPPKVPQRGSGTFIPAISEMPQVGTGKLLTYRAEVEGGSNVDADVFARAVDATLSDSKSWTADGKWAFRRVGAGKVDFVVRLATPYTVDKICGAAGLQTGGYVSCRTGELVMINLARWELAIPDYKGDVALYRRYVINHEVGHRLGHGHELCPGKGRLAPIMQQQTYGLKGCVPNGWPFVNGQYLKGPPTSNQ